MSPRLSWKKAAATLTWCSGKTPLRKCLTCDQKDKVRQKRHSGKGTVARVLAKVLREGKVWLPKEDPVLYHSKSESHSIRQLQRMVEGRGIGTWSPPSRVVGLTHKPPKQCPTDSLMNRQTPRPWHHKFRLPGLRRSLKMPTDCLKD